MFLGAGKTGGFRVLLNVRKKGGIGQNIQWFCGKIMPAAPDKNIRTRIEGIYLVLCCHVFDVLAL